MKKSYQPVYWLLIVGLLGVTAVGGVAAESISGPLLLHRGSTSLTLWFQHAPNTGALLQYRPETPDVVSAWPISWRKSSGSDGINLFRLRGLKPDTSYRFVLGLENAEGGGFSPVTIRTAPFRKLEEVFDFQVALGSCAFVADPKGHPKEKEYGGDYKIFDTIAKSKPDWMLWLGDYLYYRKGDLVSLESMESRFRWKHGLSWLRTLFHSTVHMAIWDDHDYGPNNSDAGFRLRRKSQDLFQRYWGIALEQAEGMYQQRSVGDVDFFLLDDRSFRTARKKTKGQPIQMLGERQGQWLRRSLLQSKASFKIIVLGNQILNDHTRYESFSRFPAEREGLLQWLQEQRIPGVLFLSGDRHHTELIRISRPGMYPLYDFTSSPLSSRPHPVKKGHPEFSNPDRVDGTLVTQRNFGLLRFSGDPGERKLILETRDAKGKRLWTYSLDARELDFRPQKSSRSVLSSKLSFQQR